MEVGKKIKQFEKEVKKVQEIQLNTHKNIPESAKTKTNNTEISYSSQITENLATKKEVKKTEEKILQYFEGKFNKIEKVIKKNAKMQEKEKVANRKIMENMLVQEQTFGIEERFNDYNLENSVIRPPSHSQEKSCYTISDTSSRLQPVNYFSLKNGEKGKKQKKSLKKMRSRSKSQQK